ncbi:MAG: RimK family alpha-L-glutamate ligase [Nanoarchaeota archaeon]|nr:RimK family alpha-L-glutamate ligase [Nanoarchaeota archaeon]
MKLAIISLKGKSSEMIARASSKYFDKVSSFDLRKIRVDVNKETYVMHEDKNLSEYDCIYLRGSHKYVDLLCSIAIGLKDKVYMPIIYDSFLIGHNKFLTHVKLKEEKIPFPSTHLVYRSEMAKEIVTKVNYPVVFKLLSGTHGKGVMFADSLESANSLIDMLSKLKEPYMIQEFVESGASDIRALVVGNEVISMKRSAKAGELRAGIHSGGEGTKIDLTYEDKQIAKKAARALGIDVCGVDMLKGATKTVVAEVNLSPGIVGLTKATEVNVADKIASYLYKKTEEFVQGKKEKQGKSFDLASIGRDSKEFIDNLLIKAGRIILPPSVTEAGEFEPDEEIKIKVDKGDVEIKKVKKVKI